MLCHGVWNHSKHMEQAFMNHRFAVLVLWCCIPIYASLIPCQPLASRQIIMAKKMHIQKHEHTIYLNQNMWTQLKIIVPIHAMCISTGPVVFSLFLLCGLVRDCNRLQWWLDGKTFRWWWSVSQRWDFPRLLGHIANHQTKTWQSFWFCWSAPLYF